MAKDIRLIKVRAPELMQYGSSDHKIGKERMLYLLIQEQEKVAKALIRKAKGGDIKAITEFFNRIYGAPKESIEFSGNVAFSLKRLAEQREILQAKMIEALDSKENPTYSVEND